MHFKFCPYCGKELKNRIIGDEGAVPFCERCEIPLFDMFSVCVIAAVQNEYQEVALLMQDHCSESYYTLVSGYMKPNENAETAIRREISEELGIEVETAKLVDTYWFDKKGMLMIGFICTAKKAEFQLSKEVQRASWVAVLDAFGMVHPKGSISYDLIERCAGIL